MKVLADTSLFIGREAGRPAKGPMPTEMFLSVVTVGELALGVLMATSVEHRARRLVTLREAEQLEAIPVDDAVASAWAELVAGLRSAGRRAPVNDSWIAATAIAHGLAVATQDSDYDDMPGLQVIRL